MIHINQFLIISEKHLTGIISYKDNIRIIDENNEYYDLDRLVKCHVIYFTLYSEEMIILEILMVQQVANCSIRELTYLIRSSKGNLFA